MTFLEKRLYAVWRASAAGKSWRRSRQVRAVVVLLAVVAIPAVVLLCGYRGDLTWGGEAPEPVRDGGGPVRMPWQDLIFTVAGFGVALLFQVAFRCAAYHGRARFGGECALWTGERGVTEENLARLAEDALAQVDHEPAKRKTRFPTLREIAEVVRRSPGEFRVTGFVAACLCGATYVRFRYEMGLGRMPSLIELNQWNLSVFAWFSLSLLGIVALLTDGPVRVTKGVFYEDTAMALEDLRRVDEKGNHE